MQEAHTDWECKVVQDTGKEIEVPEKVSAMVQPLTRPHTYVASEHTTQLRKKFSHMNTQLAQGDKLVKKKKKEKA